MRYRSAVLLALFCGLSAAAQNSLSVLVEGGHATPIVLKSMEHEAQGAIAPAGIAVTWLTMRDMGAGGVQGDLALMHLRGDCRPGAPPRETTSTPGERLAQTHLVDGHMLPIADVFCDAVRALIDRDLRAAPAAQRGDLLGRALGRVMAHELYHILSGTTGHAREGLARAAQSSADLLAPRNSFGEEEERKMSQSATEPGGVATDAGR